MWTKCSKNTPQKPCGLVQGRVKKEKRKLSLPSPQIPKKPKIPVKEENFWLAVIVWGHWSFLIYIISFSLNTLNHYRFLSFFSLGRQESFGAFARSSFRYSPPNSCLFFSLKMHSILCLERNFWEKGESLFTLLIWCCFLESYDCTLFVWPYRSMRCN